MRRVPVALVAVLAFSPLALAQEKTKIAKVYMPNDRIIEGEVTAEDDATITIKTDVAEAPLPKKEIVHIVRLELGPEELKARKRARNVYTSLLLGYKLVKPDDWSFKLDPPEPLSDLLIRSKDDAQISVFGIPEAKGETTLDDEALKSLSQTIETKLKEKFVAVTRVTAEKSKFKDQPSLVLEFSMKRKSDQKEFKQGEVVFRNKGKLLFFAVWAPIAKYVAAKAVFDEVMGGVQLTEANPQDGDRLFSQESLFALEKPSDWTFQKGNECAAAKNEAWVRVEPKKLEASQTLEAWAKDAEPGLAASLASAKKLSSGPANVCGRLGRQWVFEYSEGGKARRRTTWLLRDQDRGYQLTADVPADKEHYAPIVSEVIAHFRILNSLLADGALEKGLQAIDLHDEGDKRLEQKDHAGAASLYEQAVAVYPRYASAYNNLGVCELRRGEVEKARRAFQRAYELFPEDGSIRGNLSLAQVSEALELLKAKKGEEAQRLIEKARSLAPADSSVHKDALVAAFDALAIHHAEKDNWSAAASWMEKALALKPKDPQLTKNMAVICTNAAIAAYNKRATASAQSWANKALKYDPQSSKAKEVLEAVKKSK